MKDSQIIERLKDNEKAYCYMPLELQQAASDIKGKHFVCLQTDESVIKYGPKKYTSDALTRHITDVWRLHDDYKPAKPEPEIVECEISIGNDNILGFLYKKNNFNSRLNCAIEQPNFIGFKYEGNLTDTSPRMYKALVPGVTKYQTGILTDEVIDWEVLTPTHVLFRKDGE